MKKYKFTIKGNDFNVHIKEYEDQIMKMEVNGTLYEVELKSEIKASKTPKLVRKPVAQRPGEGQIARKSSGSNTVKAPLPGNIFKISVKEGDSVKKGDLLLIMEAMKMENNILAEKDGEIKKLKVAEGDAVLQGDVLIEM